MASDAKMVVAVDGTIWGTIGGGCIESAVVESAIEVAGGGAPRFVSHTLTADAAGDVGLSCGGTADLFLEPIVATPEMTELYGRVADSIRDRVPAVVCTSVNWDTGPKKAAILVDSGLENRSLSIGGLEIPNSLVDSAGRQGNVFLDEDLGVLVEYLPRKPRVVIFGAGHVGVEIAKAASAVGFHVVVYDDRSEFANAERIPWANEVYVRDFRSLFNELEVDEDDYLLATTRGHNYDALVVEHIAELGAKYVGMLGSRRKRALIFRALEAAGVSADALAQVRTPIGLDIGADTPAEISVSVVAELVKVRRKGDREA